MARYCWLASYPKSGNTWFRMVVANLHAEDDEMIDINNLPERGGIASARQPFDNILMVESGLLTHEETDRMRPMLHRFLASEDDDDFSDPQQRREEEDRVDAGIGLVKCHDAYTYTDRGEPLLGGSEAAHGAIVVMRDPRDVAPSLANHSGFDVDTAIASMGRRDFAFCGTRRNQPNQLRQQLMGWSDWQASWLDQQDIPVHPVRYEDMKRDPLETIGAALEFAGRPADAAKLERAIDLARFDRLREKEADGGFREAPVGRTFFRRGESGGWRDELSGEQVAKIERDHAVIMDRLGYDRVTDGDDEAATPNGITQEAEGTL